MENNVKIEIDDSSGFCFGVVNAISHAESSLSAGEVYCLGDIVHNRMEVQRLEALGLQTVSHADLEHLRGKRILIRAHGEPPSTYSTASSLGIDIIDATCPVVSKLQKIVADAYRQMQAENGQVVILGKHGHAEVVGLAGQADGTAIIIETEQEMETVDFSRPIYFLAQTTQSLDLFGKLADIIRDRSQCPDKVVIRDTICRQVSSREAHLREFAERFDVVIFVSGKKSSNGKVLYNVCREANPKCYNIEDSGELMPHWLLGVGSVGICGATSTPHWLMEQVAEKINDIINNNLTTL